MRIQVILVISALFTAYAQASEPGCEILNFGIVNESLQRDNIKIEHDVAVGEVGVHNTSITFSAKTDRIPAKLKINFGVEHAFTNLPPDAKILKRITHPPIQTSSGDFKTESSWLESSKSGGTSYKFDMASEVKPGPWLFQFIYNDSVICEKEFLIYAPENL